MYIIITMKNKTISSYIEQCTYGSRMGKYVPTDVAEKFPLNIYLVETEGKMFIKKFNDI